MSLKQLANPATIVGLLAALLTLVVAFGAPVTEAQTHAILVFGGALALVLFAHGITSALTYLTPQTVVGLVTAVIGVAVAFGVNVTAAQQTEILNLTGLLAGILLVHGAVHTLARDRRVPQQAPTASEHTVILRPDASELEKLMAATQSVLDSVTATAPATRSAAATVPPEATA